MSISVFKQSRGLKEEIDIQEAFNIWNATRARYQSVETIKLYKNFVHDRDFNVILGKFDTTWTASAQKYEALAKKFKLKVPQKHARDFNISLKINEITDDLIYRRIYNDLVSEMYFLTTSYRSSSTNDNVRKTLRADLESHLKDFDVLYKYGKLKGWMDDPPAYKTAKPVSNEPLAVSEAYHLLDHINLRYQKLELTKLFLSFVHDREFRLILQQGGKTLEKQANTLEGEALQYEVPLPKLPASSISASVDPEMIEDRFIYLMIFDGIQNALDLHIRAMIETIRNDQLRRLFYDLLKTELGIHENFLKYGKMKGWTKPMPIYGEPV